MQTIYDVRADNDETRLIQERIKNEKLPFRTKWGLYGTEEWFKNLESDNLVEVIKGKISRLYFSGHNDFPEFELDTGSEKYNFERSGNEDFYKLGSHLEIKCIRQKYILPISGLENTLTALVISLI